MDRPTEFDLEGTEGLVDNQGPLSDCTAEAFRSGVDVMAARAGVDFKTSVLFPYWTAGQVGGWGSADDGRKFISLLTASDHEHYGICPYDKWPTDPSKVTTRPTNEAFAAALARFIERHESVGVGTDLALQQWDDALLAGSAVFISMIVTEKFFTLRPGEIYLGTADPTATRRYGHATTIMGFSGSRKAKRDKNQYGYLWDEDGYAWLSNDVLKLDVYDARMIRQITGIPLVPGWIAPEKNTRVYLDPGEQFIVANVGVKVYGDAVPGSVALTASASKVTLDQNVNSLTLPHPSTDVCVLQTGNVLNLYFNGTLLSVWAIGSGAVLHLDEKPFPVALTAAGVMTLDGTPVNSVTPMQITNITQVKG